MVQSLPESKSSDAGKIWQISGLLELISLKGGMPFSLILEVFLFRGDFWILLLTRRSRTLCTNGAPAMGLFSTPPEPVTGLRLWLNG